MGAEVPDPSASMERVYNSSLMTALQDEENELYVQSPAYLYELLNQQPSHSYYVCSR